MKEIYFSHKKEAITFCDYLFQQDQEITVTWKNHRKWHHQLKIESSNNQKKLEKWMINGLMQVFIIHRMQDWFRDIAQTCYYYENEDEIDHILTLCDSFINDSQNRDIPTAPNPVGDIRGFFHRILVEVTKQEEVIHFESVITFRIQSIKQELIEFVGFAIDEFKREEEYQSYIQSMREYLKAKEPKLNQLLIIQGPTFLLYNEQGQLFKKEKFKHLTQEEPVYLFGPDAEDFPLPLLIALAPKSIAIYGNDPSDPKVLTVMNIFQERVQWYTLKKFPYARPIKFL